MDEKLLRITQAWEMLANAWGNQTGELTDCIRELKGRLKEVYKKWKDKYPNEDPNAFLWSRIAEALQWDRAVKKVEQLANSYKVNTKKIGLDFKQLFKARNDVAHDGKMSMEIRNNKNSPPYKLLMAAQLGIRILLLKKLGYSDKIIVTNKYEQCTYEDISEYIVK